MADPGKQRFTYDAYDAEWLGEKALALCKASRELLAGNVPKLIERANDLGAFKAAQLVEVKAGEVEEFARHTRKRREDPAGGAVTTRILSVGATVEDAIRSLGKAIGWGELAAFEDQGEEGLSAGHEWYYRFTADGTGMKAAGLFIPGGVAVTWWK